MSKSKDLPHIAVCKYISNSTSRVSVPPNTHVTITLPNFTCKRLMVSCTLKAIFFVLRSDATHEALKYNIVRVGYAFIIRLEYETSSVGYFRWN